MDKVEQDNLIGTATDKQSPSDALAYQIEVNDIIKGSAYYLSFNTAVANHKKVEPTPYENAYNEAQLNHPLVSPLIPYISESAPPAAILQTGMPKVAPLAKEKHYFRKRPLVLLLILVLSLLALALPILSALEVVPNYIDIGADIFAITDLFQDGFAFDVISDNLPIIIIGLYLIFALICVLHTLVALLGRKKKRFGIITALLLATGIAYVLASYTFDINAALAELGNLNYGVYGILACPALALILSILAYKKLK